jgi:hypothetical protein
VVSRVLIVSMIVLKRVSRVMSERRLVWRQGRSSGLAWFVHHRISKHYAMLPEKRRRASQSIRVQQKSVCT